MNAVTTLTDHFSLPWQNFGPAGMWILIMAFLVCLSCGWIGCFLMLRRMALVGDAISHSVLPGLVIGFLFTKSLGSPWLLIGAALAGLLSTLLIEWIHKLSRIKQDAAIGISFTTLFALGVLLISLFTRSTDLDQSCVLLGHLEFLPFTRQISLWGQPVPYPLLTLGLVTILEALLIVGLFKVLLVCSFDSYLARTLRFAPGRIHYLLMALTSVIIVACFEAVGAILVIALLIVPAATAFLIVRRLAAMLWWQIPLALWSTLGGWYLAAWFGCSIASAVVLASATAFIGAWFLGPAGGWLPKQVGLKGWLKQTSEAVKRPIGE